MHKTIAMLVVGLGFAGSAVAADASSTQLAVRLLNAAGTVQPSVQVKSASGNAGQPAASTVGADGCVKSANNTPAQPGVLGTGLAAFAGAVSSGVIAGKDISFGENSVRLRGRDAVVTARTCPAKGGESSDWSIDTQMTAKPQY